MSRGAPGGADEESLVVSLKEVLTLADLLIVNHLCTGDGGEESRVDARVGRDSARGVGRRKVVAGGERTANVARRGADGVGRRIFLRDLLSARETDGGEVAAQEAFTPDGETTLRVGVGDNGVGTLSRKAFRSVEAKTTRTVVFFFPMNGRRWRFLPITLADVDWLTLSYHLRTSVEVHAVKVDGKLATTTTFLHSVLVRQRETAPDAVRTSPARADGGLTVLGGRRRRRRLAKTTKCFVGDGVNRVFDGSGFVRRLISFSDVHGFLFDSFERFEVIRRHE